MGERGRRQVYSDDEIEARIKRWHGSRRGLGELWHYVGMERAQFRAWQAARAQERTAELRPLVCWPWHLHRLVDGAHPTGGRCRWCRRDIAVPADLADLRPMRVCLYCAIDRGILSAIDTPLTGVLDDA